MKEIPLTQGRAAIVDDEDYEGLIKNKWHFRDVKSEFRIGYACRSVRLEGGKRIIMMHRQVMGLGWDTSIQVDHIDGNGLNNQKSNLRICNNSENHMNQRPPRHNTSGFIGVSFDQRSGRYVAYINVNRKRFHGRSFETFEEAKAVRMEMEIKHFGEFRRKT